MPPSPPTTGLALGGGGVKGMAHVGVLAALTARGLRFDRVAGTSIGALVGAFYAAGFAPETVHRLLLEVPLSGLFALRLDARALVGVEPMRGFLREHLGDARIEDLEIPLSVVCTDLETGERVCLERGDVVEAVMASSAVPGVFAPVRLDGRVLVDGGLTDNLPVSVLRERGCERVVAVRLVGSQPSGAWPSLRRTRMSRWAHHLAEALEGGDRVGTAIGDPRVLQTVARSVDILTAGLEAATLAAVAPDVLVTPDLAAVGFLDVTEDREGMYARGVEAVDAVADRIAEVFPDAAPRGLPSPS